MHPRCLAIKDFTYELPDNRIAKYPLTERDLSKLLVYENGEITEDIYRNVDLHLPADSLLIFNNTRVIHARIFFKNANGGKVEVFCLEPVMENAEMASAMSQRGKARWNCLVGRASKWKEKVLEHKTEKFTLTAELVDRNAENFIVEFKWTPADLTFAEILDATGFMPIPPYLKRESDEVDESRYQTVYAEHKGSVAAPTAGLHFTPNIFEKLKAKNIDTAFVTLHVGAGTFKPVKAEVMDGHDMHAEMISVNAKAIQTLLDAGKRNIIAVGTTSLRTIESLYWMGVKAHENLTTNISDLEIKQWDVYETKTDLSTHEALRSLLKWMEKNNQPQLVCKTQILIAPGYTLKVANGLITNFHQPNSTLLLLVASIVGDKWKEIYNYAMQHNFRFLSYGDGSLLWKNKV